MAGLSKPTVEDLQLDLAALDWQRSGEGDGALEVAMVDASGQRWVLVRVAGDPHGRVLIYSPYEWECFLDGARGGEFEDAAD